MMIKNRKTQFFLLLLVTMGFSLAVPISAEEHKTVTDMLGLSVEVPSNIERVVAIDDGFDRVVFKVVIALRCFLRNHVHVRLKYNGFTVFHARSSRFAYQYIAYFVA